MQRTHRASRSATQALQVRRDATIFPRGGYPELRDCVLGCIRLLLSAGADISVPTDDGVCTFPACRDYAYNLPGLHPKLVEFLKLPPARFVGMQAVPDVQARQGFVLAWSLAGKHGRPGVGRLPLDLVRAIALSLPEQPDPTKEHAQRLHNELFAAKGGWRG